MDNTITIEQVAATIAHEVKNPISLVLANVDLLEAEDSSGKNKKNYKVMRRELNKVMNIMLDFIQLAKPPQAEFEDIDINEFLLDIIDNCREVSRERIDFIFDSEDYDIKVKADSLRLSRVFFNIYKNAMEAIEDTGSITTAIWLEGSYINISIADTGVGINEEVCKKILTPFFTTKESGSGLGVFISKNIVESHNGVFEIEGKEGEGCKVTVKLPL